MGGGLRREVPGHVRLRPLGRARKRRSLLVRDRIGIKPLYYTLLADGTLVFGSELKTILAHPGVGRGDRAPGPRPLLDPRIRPGAPYSMFKGIFKLPAGSFLDLRGAGRSDLSKYWDVDRLSRTAADEPPPRLARRSRTSSTPCSRNRSGCGWSATSRSGAFLSGGIDSSTIVGLMRELGASPAQDVFDRVQGQLLQRARPRPADRRALRDRARGAHPRAPGPGADRKARPPPRRAVRRFFDLPDVPRLRAWPAAGQSRPLGRRRGRGLRRLRSITRPRRSPACRRRGRGPELAALATSRLRPRRKEKGRLEQAPAVHPGVRPRAGGCAISGG